MRYESRFIVGIDLGTTNTAVAFVDTESSTRSVEQMPIPQLVAPGELSQPPLLPSFCFFPDDRMLADGALSLPWRADQRHAVGVFARDHGADSPSRLVFSAKSWLCHAGVDRRGKILPWRSEIPGLALSPVEASRLIIGHAVQAWNHTMGGKKDRQGNPCLLSEQQVVLTVPASFDETARELTIEAARLAGLKNLSLVEEPLAAFYSWLDVHESTWRERIQPGDKVLVVDIGGGTCDFSVIEMDSEGGLSRAAAGNHLLLGGDNIDAAVARKAEEAWGMRLSQSEWASLCQKSRMAKEEILGKGLDKCEVTLFPKGSSIIGGMRRFMLRREELVKLIDDGFFPIVPFDSPPPAKRSGIQEMGLPYVTDPAATRHLLDFLRQAGRAESGQAAGSTDARSEVLRPDKVLFNGGTTIPEAIRRRLLDALASWFGSDYSKSELESADPHLAVARGAAYFGSTRRGVGVRIHCGTACSYYVGAAADGGVERYVCVMPRGVEENVSVVTPRVFRVETNRKAQFKLFSSATRIGDKAGDAFDDAERLTPVSRLVNVLRFGSAGETRSIDARIGAELTETGVLKLWIESLESSHKWPLSFDIRIASDDGQPKGDGTVFVIEHGRIRRAVEVAMETIAAPERHPGAIKALERELDLPRDDWPAAALREMADALLAMGRGTLRDPRAEARWLNLCGFCLRPGFGDPADDLRMRSVWKFWQDGVICRSDPQANAEWWVFWRRVAPGLKAGHQRAVAQDVMKSICPNGKYVSKVKAGPQTKAEMWRCLGSLELLDHERKKAVGDLLVSRIDRLEPFEFWVLGRLGARRLFHAPASCVIPADVAAVWLGNLLASGARKPEPALIFTVSRLAAMTGDRGLDLAPDSVAAAKAFLTENKASLEWIRHLDGVAEDSPDESVKVLGDSIPHGLSLKDDDPLSVPSC